MDFPGEAFQIIVLLSIHFARKSIYLSMTDFDSMLFLKYVYVFLILSKGTSILLKLKNASPPKPPTIDQQT